MEQPLCSVESFQLVRRTKKTTRTAAPGSITWLIIEYGLGAVLAGIGAYFAATSNDCEEKKVLNPDGTTTTEGLSRGTCQAIGYGSLGGAAVSLGIGIWETTKLKDSKIHELQKRSKGKRIIKCGKRQGVSGIIVSLEFNNELKVESASNESGVAKLKLSEKHLSPEVELEDVLLSVGTLKQVRIDTKPMLSESQLARRRALFASLEAEKERKRQEIEKAKIDALWADSLSKCKDTNSIRDCDELRAMLVQFPDHQKVNEGKEVYHAARKRCEGIARKSLNFRECRLAYKEAEELFSSFCSEFRKIPVKMMEDKEYNRKLNLALEKIIHVRCRSLIEYRQSYPTAHHTKKVQNAIKKTRSRMVVMLQRKWDAVINDPKVKGKIEQEIHARKVEQRRYQEMLQRSRELQRKFEYDSSGNSGEGGNYCSSKCSKYSSGQYKRCMWLCTGNSMWRMH